MVQAQQDDGGINKDASHCGDVAQLGAGKFNCSVERRDKQTRARWRERVKESESRVRCQVESALQAAAGTGLTASPSSVDLLELAKVQIEGEERDGECDAHAGECGYGVEGQRSNGGHTQLEHTLRNGHLPTVPLDRATARAAEVQGICGRVVEGDGFQQTALDLIECGGAHAIWTAEGDGTLHVERDKKRERESNESNPIPREISLFLVAPLLLPLTDTPRKCSLPSCCRNSQAMSLRV